MKSMLVLLALCSAPVFAQEVKIAMVGDVLLHQPQHKQALRAPNGHVSLWQQIVPLLQRADIAYANLEGPIAPGVAGLGRQVADPGRVFDKRVYTSYPMFNYHDFLADDLKTSGFDIVSTANNHALDRGSVGASATIEQLQRVQLLHSGTRANASQPFAARIRSKGMVVSFVACTEHTNGIPDKEQQVLLCNNQTLDLVRSEAQIADAVVVTPHWGDEYQPLPNARQKNFAQQLAHAGATVIVGSHPHVTQPLAVLTVGSKQVPVVYSLGNFVSNQFHRQATQKEYFAWVTLKRSSSGVVGEIAIKNMKMVRGENYHVVFTEPD